MNEIWKPIPNYEGFYEVSNLGRIRRVEHQDKNGHTYRMRILKPANTGTGYKHVHLSKNGNTKWFQVHRLVAEVFCEKPNGMDVVNHLDNDPSNNRADNLEWTDYKGNMQHASKQGRMGWQPENLAKACETKKIPVIAISKNGKKQRFESSAEAARKLGVQRSHIAACCRQEYGYKTVGGYRFEYADEAIQALQKPIKIGRTKEELSEFKRKQMLGNTIMVGRHLTSETKQKLSMTNGRRVQQVNKETGEVVAEFQSANEAKKQTGISHISSCANGSRKSAGGYLWRYIE